MKPNLPPLDQLQPELEGRVLRFEELTGQLTVEDFDAVAERLLRKLDRDNVAIDTRFERRKRPSWPSANTNLLTFYRSEVQRVPVMDREEELRFCMGLEFLWRRLKKARKAAGFNKCEIERYPDGSDPNCRTCPPGRERICFGCSPASLPDGVRGRLRSRHQEFEAARNEVIERNLHIVFRLLERYRGVGVPMEDMIQEANYSLFKAVENFDFTRGVRFKTYAAYWVNQAFLNAIYNQSRTVRVPAYIQKAMKKINDAASGVGPSLDDVEAISRESGVPVDLVQTAITGNRFTLSLDKSLDDEDGGKMVDLVPADAGDPDADTHDSHRLSSHLDDAVRMLSQREQMVLRLRFGLDGEDAHTLAEVGDRLQISLERVRQIQKGAIDKIRKSEKYRLLEQYN
ncbi:MAG: sigma-70 family RNA polymerase sigma factor [Planctomycetota bacterium]|nr:MAG: sigma-70 family RNA polymerase sigma factor [Planctomycetota bacterium]